MKAVATQPPERSYRGRPKHPRRGAQRGAFTRNVAHREITAVEEELGSEASFARVRAGHSGLEKSGAETTAMGWLSSASRD